MRMHEVEVDDEVFSFVKGHAEPLVDDFNSALRRLLPIGGTKVRNRGSSKTNSLPDHSSASSLPRGTPMALRQILEVISLVRGGAYGRTDATRFVAKQHGVEPQTVIDKYTRQLGGTAGRFDRLLEQEDRGELRQILVSKFPSYRPTIEEVVK
jgi:hypothetical protein